TGEQHRGAEELRRHAFPGNQDTRDEAHDDQVQRADQREPHRDLFQVLRRLITGTVAGDERAALLQILGGLLRVVLQRRIEEAEKYDRRRVQYLVHRLARGKRRRQVAQPDRVLTRAKPLRQRRRKENDRRRENRRNHAGHVELERQ